MSTLSDTPEWVIYVSCLGAFFQILRFSIDVIKVASIREHKKESAIDEGSESGSTRSDKSKKYTKSSSVLFSSLRKAPANTIVESEHDGSSTGDDKDDVPRSVLEVNLSRFSVLLHIGLLSFFVTMAVLIAREHSQFNIHETIYNEVPLGATSIGIFFSLLTSIQDYKRTRFSLAQRIVFPIATTITLLSSIILISTSTQKPTSIDYTIVALLIVYFILSLVERKVFTETIVDKSGKKAHLGKALIVILKPYFWPDATASSAMLNRTRAILTWVFVSCSKACSLIAPIFLGKASSALSKFDYVDCAKNAIIYAVISFSSSFFKECQSLIYLKVAQAAFVQLSEVSFYHLHSLSLDWHLKKKLGETIRSMDRGIMACDVLMKYLFLWMVPAVGEAILVCVIFALYFKYLPLALTIFIFVFVYIIWTIMVTLWRKKFRKSVAKSDNKWHDISTDSLVNFETVKYFTAEKYEIERFSESVAEFQSSSVQVQASLGFLNLTQTLLMQSCLATALVFASLGIKEKYTCCLDNGCDMDGLVTCCADIGSSCSGMDIGDFVAVLTYTLNLFAPLTFLGSVYNAIVMAMIDLRNLSELLAEEPDLKDAPDALAAPKSNAAEPDIAVEFDNVVFKYPSQAEGQGLTGVSFKMMRGTTTAIVGTTGAGKTTISRLFFRFYDVLGGAVKVNGVDVRAMTQKSLREMIGVVPQSTSMFNDTLKQNILYGKRDATEEELNKVADSAQLTDFIRTLPDGWETMVGDRGLKLSGGEKQRTAIARCLLKDPPFVVLDEATSALDTVTENSIQEALDALGTERTCLVIAHRLGTIRNADNIIVLGDGGVLEQGSHDELLETNGKYAEMWNMQLHSTGNNSSLSLANLEEDMNSKKDE